MHYVISNERFKGRMLSIVWSLLGLRVVDLSDLSSGELGAWRIPPLLFVFGGKKKMHIDVLLVEDSPRRRSADPGDVSRRQQ